MSAGSGSSSGFDTPFNHALRMLTTTKSPLSSAFWVFFAAISTTWSKDAVP